MCSVRTRRVDVIKRLLTSAYGGPCGSVIVKVDTLFGLRLPGDSVDPRVVVDSGNSTEETANRVFFTDVYSRCLPLPEIMTRDAFLHLPSSNFHTVVVLLHVGELFSLPSAWRQR